MTRWNPPCCFVIKSCPALCNSMNCGAPGFPVLAISWCLLKLMSIELVMPSHHLSLYCLLLLPSIFPSIRLFSKKLALCIRWSSIGASNECSGVVSFRIDWFDLAVQRTLKSLLQLHSLKASILRHSAIFTVQLSHLYLTTGKNIALTRWTFVGKVMSLLFNMLSSFVIVFLPRASVFSFHGCSHHLP